MEHDHTTQVSTGGSGQGLLEYALIIILAIMVIASVLALAMPGIQAARRARLTANPAKGASVTNIAESQSKEEVIGEELYPVDNCLNKQDAAITLSRNQVIEYRVKVIDDIAPALKDLVIQQLQARYGVADKASAVQTYAIPLATPAGQSLMHKIEWRYTWKEGLAKLKLGDGSVNVVSYRVGVALAPSVSASARECRP